MGAWSANNLIPAVAAVPSEWTDDSTIWGSAAGAALIAALGGGLVGYDGLKSEYDSFKEAKKDITLPGGRPQQKMTIKDVSGNQAMQVAYILADFYSIYSALQTGDIWRAAVSAVDVVPRMGAIASDRAGWDALFKSKDVTTAILDYTGYALMGLEYCFGFMARDRGELFTDGAKQFRDGNAALRQLMPDAQWTGSASTGFGEAVAQLQKLASDMADTDARMAEVLRVEEDQLIQTRNIINTAKRTLSFAVIPAKVIWASPNLGGPPASEVFQYASATAALATAALGIANQLGLSYNNGQLVSGQGQEQYATVIDAAEALYATLST